MFRDERIDAPQAWARRQAADYSRPPLHCNRVNAKGPSVSKSKEALENQGDLLVRIAAALERLAPPPLAGAVPVEGDAFVWEPAHGGLVAVPSVASLPLSLLKAVDFARETLLENTRRFAEGLPANNALLWGARGMGK